MGIRRRAAGTRGTRALVGHIDGDTITPTWAGERLDLSAVLAGLLPERAWLEVA